MVVVSKDLVYDFADWWREFYKKTCLSNDSYGKNVPREQKKSFSISSYHHITISSANEVICREFINCLVSDTFRLRNTLQNLTLPTKKAYSEKIPINKNKMDHLMLTMKFIPEAYAPFWQEITAWPTNNKEYDD